MKTIMKVGNFFLGLVCLFTKHQWKTFPTEPFATHICRRCELDTRE